MAFFYDQLDTNLQMQAWAVTGGGGTPAPAPKTFAFNSGDKWYNSAQTGIPSALSENLLRAEGPSAIQAQITFDCTIFVEGAASSMVGVYAGNTYIGRVQATQQGLNTQTIALPGGAEKDYRFVDGPQSRVDDTGEVHYTTVTSITLTGATTATKLPWVRRPMAVAVTTDSIGMGFGTSDPMRYGWLMDLRNTEAYDLIIVQSWGYASWGRSLSTTQLQAAHVDQIMYALSGATEKHWYDSRATNCYGFNYATPAQMKAYKQATLAELRGRQGGVGVIVHLQTLLARTAPAVGSQTFSVADYSQAIRDIGTADTTVRVADTIGWAVTLADGLHPDDGGAGSVADEVRTTLIGQNVPFDSNTYATLANSESFAPQQFSVVARIKPASFAADSVVACKAHFEAGGVFGLFGFFLNSNTRRLSGAIYAQGGGTAATVASAADFVLGQEYDVAFTYDGTTATLYVGSEVASVTVPVAAGSSTDKVWLSGVYNQVSGNRELAFLGEVANFSLFTTALGAGAIADIIARDCRLTQAEYTADACYAFSTLARPAGATQLANLADNTKPIELIGTATGTPVTVRVSTSPASNFQAFGLTWQIDNSANEAYCNAFGDYGLYTITPKGTTIAIRGNTGVNFLASQVRLTLSGQPAVIVNTQAGSPQTNAVLHTFSGLTAGATYTVRIENAQNNQEYVVTTGYTA